MWKPKQNNRTLLLPNKTKNEEGKKGKFCHVDFNYHADVYLRKGLLFLLFLIVTVEERLASAVLVRPLSGMDPHVNQQPLFLSKDFTTVWTGKGHPLPSVVPSPVHDPGGTRSWIKVQRGHVTLGRVPGHTISQAIGNTSACPSNVRSLINALR